MKVTRLQASNILRLVAVDIKPEGALVTIGGANGAGKSSAMNSIAMALGGQALCPSEPIRVGESEAEIRVDFDTDLVVTRKFSREKVHAQNCATRDTNLPDPIKCSCDQSWSETKSTLIVANKAGAKYPSPQALLDRLVGRLAFDPLAFKDDKDQASTLRRLVNLDVSAYEKTRADAASSRAMLKKTLAIKQAQLAAMPRHDGAPAQETPITAEKLVEAERLRKLAGQAEHDAAQMQDRKTDRVRLLAEQRATLVELQKQVTALEGHIAAGESQLADVERDVDAAKITAHSARAVVPDVTAISAEMAATEVTNAKVRANQRHEEANQEIGHLEMQIEEAQFEIDRADDSKAAALRAVQFPVVGLGLSDDGVTFNGLPLAQASSAEQLRVSAAIGFALNPTLKVVLIKNGNLLDDDSLAALAKQSEEAGAQCWVEWVTKDKSEVQVFIEDGHVAV